jgi:hypothetical protein
LTLGVEFSLGAGRGILSRTPAVLDELLRDLPDGWVAADEGAGTWSPYQVVGHLLHLEESDWLDRARVILAHDHGAFRPIDREAGFARFEGWSLVALLDRFTEARYANLADLDALVTPADLARIGTHPDFGSVTLSELLATWVVHDLNHLGQIVKTMAKQYRAAVGPWREYLPIVDAI